MTAATTGRAFVTMACLALVAASGCSGDGGAEAGSGTSPSPPSSRPGSGLTAEPVDDAAFATQFTAVADGDVWLANPGDGQVSRVDGASGRVVTEIAVGDPDLRGAMPDPQSVTSDPAGQVWAGVFSTRSAVRIDPATNGIAESVPLGIQPYGLVVTGTDIWATHFEGHAVVRVDRASGAEVARITGVRAPTAILQADDAIWVAGLRSGRVFRIDPATNAVDGAAETDGTIEGMIAHDGAIWVASNSGQALHRVDPVSLEVASIPLGSNAYGIAGGPDGIWVTVGPGAGCDETNSAVVLVDPERRVERDRLSVECAFAVAALPDGRVLVGVDTWPARLVSVRWRG